MGVYIIKEAFAIGREAMGSLLDISAGGEIEEKIKKIAKNQNIELDSLKTQKKGSAITANLEIKLPNDLSVEKANNISNNLREELAKKIENLKYIAIQIKSHDIITNFYKPDFGRGFEWQRRGKFKEEVKEATGQGPVGNCICPECGYKTPHKRGIPCSSLKCPKCNLNLKRE